MDKINLTRLTNVEIKRKVEETSFSRLAVQELYRRDPRSLKASLEKIIIDEKRSADDRSKAVVQMTLYPEVYSENVLKKVVAIAAAPVVRRAAEALGKYGGRDALNVLAKLKDSSDKIARKSVEFARSLLAYRYGVEGFRVKAEGPILELNRSKAVKLEIKKASQKEFQQAMNLNSEKRLPIEVSGNGSQLIKCGTEVLMLVFEKRVQTSTSRISLIHKPSIVAVLMGWAEALQTWHLEEYIFCYPLTSLKAELVGIRSSGHQVHRGEAAIQRQGVAFKLGAFETPHALPLQLTGLITGTTTPTIKIDALSETVRDRNKNVPKKIIEEDKNI